MRVFRLKKDVPDVSAGAVFTDGPGGYICVSKEKLTHGCTGTAYPDKTVVEDNPEWFEEVFPVLPEYATKEEIAKMKRMK